MSERTIRASWCINEKQQNVKMITRINDGWQRTAALRRVPAGGSRQPTSENSSSFWVVNIHLSSVNHDPLWWNDVSMQKASLCRQHTCDQVASAGFLHNISLAWNKYSFLYFRDLGGSLIDLNISNIHFNFVAVNDLNWWLDVPFVVLCTITPYLRCNTATDSVASFYQSL